jgi:hypothetical protein
VITSYPVGWLPGLEEIWIHQRFLDYGDYEMTLRFNPQVQLILVPIYTPDPRIIAEIWQRINSGEYQLILSEANYMLIKIPPRVDS